jgi:hypothetical protein
MIKTGTCQIPGCSKTAHKNTNGSTGRYCGLAHKEYVYALRARKDTAADVTLPRLAEKACLYCRKAQKQGDRLYCGQSCADEATKKGPLVLEVPEDHVTFRSGNYILLLPANHADRFVILIS